MKLEGNLVGGVLSELEKGSGGGCEQNASYTSMKSSKNKKRDHTIQCKPNFPFHFSVV